MNFITEYWWIIPIALVVIALIIIAFMQPKKIREWLLYAVSEAEKELGGGTGALKLRLVYDRFVAKFPWLSVIITFNRFSYFVDEALKEMKVLLSKNVDIALYIYGEKEE